VVEKPDEVIALENVGGYKGRYHVLGGVINPLEHIGPDDLKINELIDRLNSQKEKYDEVILALNPTMEGEATSLFIHQQIKKIQKKKKKTKKARKIIKMLKTWVRHQVLN
jgi:recombination protein RecR